MASRGAPPGNKNAAKGRRWFEAIDKALKQYTDKKRKVEAGEALDRIALLVVREALDGSFWAIAEIADRLDGKAAQSIDISGEVTHVRELSDGELLERIAALTAEDSPGVH
jgi:hypothetical protein